MSIWCIMKRGSSWLWYGKQARLSAINSSMFTSVFWKKHTFIIIFISCYFIVTCGKSEATLSSCLKDYTLLKATYCIQVVWGSYHCCQPFLREHDVENKQKKVFTWCTVNEGILSFPAKRYLKKRVNCDLQHCHRKGSVVRWEKPSGAAGSLWS